MSNDYFVTIINESPIPINVETWRSLCFGLSEMESITLKPGDKKFMSSETGEWFIIVDKVLCEQYNLSPGKAIGKFRIEPSIWGGNLWMCDNGFKVVCHNGVAHFSKIM